MVAFLSPLLLKKQSTFVGYSTAYTTPGTDTIAIPVGATTATVECYAAGGGGRQDGLTITHKSGGGGGAYARKNTHPVAGLTAIYISVPDTVGAETTGQDCFARENTSGGAVICLAKGGAAGVAAGTAAGGSATSSVGDVKFRGGQSQATSNDSSGGGGGGPSGAGGDSINSGTGGAGGGGVAGAGGARADTADPGQNYGGGGGGSTLGALGFGGAGAQGYLKLTWA